MQSSPEITVITVFQRLKSRNALVFTRLITKWQGTNDNFLATTGHGATIPVFKSIGYTLGWASKRTVLTGRDFMKQDSQKGEDIQDNGRIVEALLWFLNKTFHQKVKPVGSSVLFFKQEVTVGRGSGIPLFSEDKQKVNRPLIVSLCWVTHTTGPGLRVWMFTHRGVLGQRRVRCWQSFLRGTVLYQRRIRP